MGLIAAPAVLATPVIPPAAERSSGRTTAIVESDEQHQHGERQVRHQRNKSMKFWWPQEIDCKAVAACCLKFMEAFGTSWLSEL